MAPGRRAQEAPALPRRRLAGFLAIAALAATAVSCQVPAADQAFGPGAGGDPGGTGDHGRDRPGEPCAVVPTTDPTTGMRGVTADCPGADLRDADLAGLLLWFPDLSGADLTGADLRGSTLVSPTMVGTTLDGADLREVSVIGGIWEEASFVEADLRDGTWAEASGARNDLTRADLAGVAFDQVWWDDSDFTGTLVVPVDVEVVGEPPGGAAVTWPEPAAIGGTGGATPGDCDHRSGDAFPLGTTEVRCEVLLPAGVPSHGTFRVTVHPAERAAGPERPGGPPR